MRVLFIGVGLVHYFNQILNRLNALEDIDIINLIPKTGKGHLEEGVYSSDKNASFKISKLAEKKLKPFTHSFEGLSDLLRREEPQIIVFTDFYRNIFLFDIPVILTVKRLGIKLIMKSIPFRLNKYADALRSAENLPQLDKYLPRKLQGKFNYLWIRKCMNLLKVELYRWSINIPHAHVNYVEAAREIFQSYGVSRQKIFITYNSPDTDISFALRRQIEKEPPILPANKNRLIHVGRLVEWKRVDMLIRSFQAVKNKFADAELIIIGDGPEKKKLMILSQEMNLTKSISFTGSIYDPNILGKNFLASSIYILAGMGGISINEAMSFSLPIICSVCDGTEKKLVRDGHNGLFFKDQNQNDLTEKIIYLLENDELRKRMGYHSIEIIQNEINIHSVIKGYLNAFYYVTENPVTQR